MKLHKFRIFNYKSIKDSGDCYVEQAITILAGKNEAGKTAILEALEDFNIANSIRDSAKPLYSHDAIPEVILTLQLSPEDVAQIAEGIGNPIKTPKEVTVEIKKTYPAEYGVNADALEPFGLKETSLLEQDRQEMLSIHGEIKEKLASAPTASGEFPDVTFDNSEEFIGNLDVFKNSIQTSVEVVDQELRNSISSLIDKLIDIVKTRNPKDKFLNEVKKLLPNFVLFNSFEDVFPSSIPLADVESNDLIKDLISISELKMDVITKGLPHEKIQHKEQLNIAVKESYKKFWSQDFSNLHFEWDNEQLYFHIKEDGMFYPPEIRSQGKRWHLAFYIRVTARSKENKNNIILIDEPGLFLHATAQRDILNKLEDISKTNQIIFSTHSPYLLDPEKFHRIRLVYRGAIPKMVEGGSLKSIDVKFSPYYEEKNHKSTMGKYYTLKKEVDKLSEEDQNILKGALFRMDYNIGTVIEGKIHKVADKEALTPILTAIGLELTTGITNLDKKNNVVCEGQSDFFYLQAFKKIFNYKDVNFIFGGGSGNMPIVGTILSGWGCNVLYLYDNDKGKKDGEKNLKHNWIMTEAQLLSVSEIDGGSIEDVFASNDFKKFVLENETTSYTGLNSDYIETAKLEKILLSRNFMKNHEADSIVLSEKTKKNVKKIFEEVEKKFKEEF